MQKSTDFKTVLQIYKDCLLLVQHNFGESAKAKAVIKMIRHEFRKNRDVTDTDKIHELKFNAVRGLTNYLLYQASLKDSKLQKPEEKIPSPSTSSMPKPKFP